MSQDKLIKDINTKYQDLGENPDPYLSGLRYTNPVNYWDYCEVDTLLTLQKPKTFLQDENVFIMYHQVNELLFKMILSEIEQVSNEDSITLDFFVAKLGRINRYFDVLISSFAIMKYGMDVDQYMKFRDALTPASGFQSVQYRKIEIACTDLNNLLDARYKEKADEIIGLQSKIDHLYWQAAGKNYKTGKKSLMLSMFEEKYGKELLATAKKYEHTNLRAVYNSLNETDKKSPKLIKAMKALDNKINIKWTMTHYRTAEHYLESSGKPVAATGGSPWKKYMHPKYQKRIFFPELWSEEELDTWGHEHKE
ncbi:MAG: tryptophan 2,3-dioxygenase [Flavobacteriales bacterium]|nr:tryptophan 2,3-dioxygenase [Flavobacteriales bacterium]